MPVWKSCVVVGLALTAIGAVVLLWRELLGKAKRQSDLSAGPKPASRWGFGLIAFGSILQIIGTIAAPH